MTAGGYRAPANPAPVSGPGELSRRTDGGPGQPVRDMPASFHGEATALREQQAAAPMAAASGPPAPIGFDVPTARPDEPVTAGVDRGPGPGSEVLRPAFGTDAVASYGPLTSMLQGLAASDVTGSLAALVMEAQRRGI